MRVHLAHVDGDPLVRYAILRRRVDQLPVVEVPLKLHARASHYAIVLVRELRNAGDLLSERGSKPSSGHGALQQHALCLCVRCDDGRKGRDDASVADRIQTKLC